MITRHFKKLLFKMALVILPIISAQGVTITYNLNGGVLPNGSGSYQTDSNNNNNAVLDNPTKTGYIFTGWCDTNDYTAATNTCSNRVGLVTTNNNNATKTMVRWTVPNDLSTDTTFIAMWEEDKFQVTTTNISANDYFGFALGAAGTFWVDWGDGNVEYITQARPNYWGTGSSGWTMGFTKYSHTYTSGGVYTVRFGGLATGYKGGIFNDNTLYNLVSAIHFGYSDSITGNSVNEGISVSFGYDTHVGKKIVGISGSLGALFPTISGYDTYNISTNLLFEVQPMFSGTFSGCSGLTGQIPATLFSGISGAPAQYMFASTFNGCSGLTGSIPATLFSGISGTPAVEMFRETFSGCSGLTGPIPATLFSGITKPDPNNTAGTTATYQMLSVFDGTGLLTSCPSGMSQYITGFESYFDSRVSCMQTDMVLCSAGQTLVGTSCATCPDPNDCPTAPTQYTCPNGSASNTTHDGCFLTGYTITYDLDGGTVATANPTTYNIETSTITLNNPTKSGYVFVGWCDDANLTENCTFDKKIAVGSTGNKHFYAAFIEENYPFQVTTTNLSAGDSVSFNISAAGRFLVDCGTGGVLSGSGVVEGSGVIIRGSANGGNTYTNTYTCTYDTVGGVKTVRLGGRATQYGSTSAAIKFYSLSRLAGISGSLGAVFPTIGATTQYDPTAGLNPNDVTDAATLNKIQPKFDQLFYGGCALTGQIPASLFDGIVGQPREAMFRQTFDGCSGLTGEIPAALFSGLSGIPVSHMFWLTFHNCSRLGRDAVEDDPSTTNVVENAPKYSIPATLFSGIVGAPAPYMFYGTFYGCSGLTGEIPATLFSGISGTPAEAMFWGTFYDCTNLGIDTNGDSTYSVPPMLFNGIDSDPSKVASYQMGSVFYNTGLLTSCPSGMSQYITGFESYFDSRVSCMQTDMVLCSAGQTLVGTACATCPDPNDCPTAPTQYTCPNGYLANPTHDGCLTGYTITYDLDGGTVATANPATYTSADATFTLNNPTKSGYIFAGWCENAALTEGCDDVDANGFLTKTISTGSTGNKTFYAKWTEDKFQVTTTNLSAGDYFAFKLYATGTFLVDWGDGSVEKIVRTTSSSAINPSDSCRGDIYSHTYEASGVKTVRFGGIATGYRSGTIEFSGPTMTDNFYCTEGSVNKSVNNSELVVSANTNKLRLSGISGSLGALFPTIGVTAQNPDPTAGLDPETDAETLNAIQPSFDTIFAGCANLTGPIPPDLFTGVVGQPRFAMFRETFFGCSGLGRDALEDDPSTANVVENAPKYSIPATLFSGISGAPAEEMFNSTFYGCSGLTGSIPENLFGRVVNGTYYGISGSVKAATFRYTFGDCSGLTGSIPENLFGRVVNGTYYGVVDPASYFVGGAGGPFVYTFAGCSNLTGQIPANLFAGMSSYADRFAFYNCTNLGKNEINGNSTYYIPPTLFPGRVDAKNCSGDQAGFDGTGFLTSCPSGKIIYDTLCSKVSCITPDSIVCPAGQSLTADGNGNYVCTNCSGADCPAVRTVVSCPIGYTNNRDFSACIQPYTITYANVDMPGVTFSDSVPVQYYYDNNTGYYYYRTVSSADWRQGSSFTLNYTNNPTRLDGSTFLGWCDNIELTSNCAGGCSGGFCGSKSVFFSSLQNLTYYAKWEETYNITYYGLEGSNIEDSNPNPSTYTNTSSTYIDYQPTKSGYAFVGWCVYDSTTNDGVNCANPEMSASITNGSTGDRYVYAVWREHTVTCSAGNYAYVWDNATGLLGCRGCPAGYYCPGDNGNSKTYRYSEMVSTTIAGDTVMAAGIVACDPSTPYSRSRSTSASACSVCPPTYILSAEDGYGVLNLGSSWFDLNGNNAQDSGECIDVMYTQEMQTCMMKAMCENMPAHALQAMLGSNYTAICTQLASVTCDYAGNKVSYMTCRYNANTYGSAGVYTDCSKMINICNETELLGALSVLASNQSSAAMFPVELNARTDVDTSDLSAVNWNGYFYQNLMSVVAQIMGGADAGTAISSLDTYNTCSGGSSTFTCESNTWLHVGNEQICTYATKTTDRALAIRVDANHVYYVMLTPASENDYPIHAGSNYKLKIREYNAAGTESTIYNAHDMSVVSE